MNQARELTQFAQEKLDFYGLTNTGWRFGFGRSKRRIGVCKFSKKLIEVSYYYLANTSVENLKDTILHEIAHAIAGPTAKHGPEWRRVCQLVGARPERCGNSEFKSSAIKNWQGKCSGCGLVMKKQHRRPKYKYMYGSYHNVPTCGPTTRIVWTKIYSAETDKIAAQTIAGL